MNVETVSGGPERDLGFTLSINMFVGTGLDNLQSSCWGGTVYGKKSCVKGANFFVGSV